MKVPLAVARQITPKEAFCLVPKFLFPQDSAQDSSKQAVLLFLNRMRYGRLFFSVHITSLLVYLRQVTLTSNTNPIKAAVLIVGHGFSRVRFFILWYAMQGSF